MRYPLLIHLIAAGVYCYFLSGPLSALPAVLKHPLAGVKGFNGGQSLTGKPAPASRAKPKSLFSIGFNKISTKFQVNTQ